MNAEQTTIINALAIVVMALILIACLKTLKELFHAGSSTAATCDPQARDWLAVAFGLFISGAGFYAVWSILKIAT